MRISIILFSLTNGKILGESTASICEYKTLAPHIACLPQYTFTVSCQRPEHWDVGREMHNQQITAPHIQRTRQAWQCCGGYFCSNFYLFFFLKSFENQLASLVT